MKEGALWKERRGNMASYWLDKRDTGEVGPAESSSGISYRPLLGSKKKGVTWRKGLGGGSTGGGGGRGPQKVGKPASGEKKRAGG